MVIKPSTETQLATSRFKVTIGIENYSAIGVLTAILLPAQSPILHRPASAVPTGNVAAVRAGRVGP